MTLLHTSPPSNPPPAQSTDVKQVKHAALVYDRYHPSSVQLDAFETRCMPPHEFRNQVPTVTHTYHLDVHVYMYMYLIVDDDATLVDPHTPIPTHVHDCEWRSVSDNSKPRVQPTQPCCAFSCLFSVSPLAQALLQPAPQPCRVWRPLIVLR